MDFLTILVLIGIVSVSMILLSCLMLRDFGHAATAMIALLWVSVAWIEISERTEAQAQLAEIEAELQICQEEQE